MNDIEDTIHECGANFLAPNESSCVNQTVDGKYVFNADMAYHSIATIKYEIYAWGYIEY